jgi:hypothetical protein
MESTTTRYQCRHIFTEGRRSQSPTLPDLKAAADPLYPPRPASPSEATAGHASTFLDAASRNTWSVSATKTEIGSIVTRVCSRRQFCRTAEIATSPSSSTPLIHHALTLAYTETHQLSTIAPSKVGHPVAARLALTPWARHHASISLATFRILDICPPTAAASRTPLQVGAAQPRHGSPWTNQRDKT